MEEITEKIIKAKDQRNYALVQKLQQQLDAFIIRKLEDKHDMEDFPKHGTKKRYLG